MVVYGGTFWGIHFDASIGEPLSEGQHMDLERIEHVMFLFVLGDDARLVCMKGKINTSMLSDTVIVEVEQLRAQEWQRMLLMCLVSVLIVAIALNNAYFERILSALGRVVVAEYLDRSPLTSGLKLVYESLTLFEFN